MPNRPSSSKFAVHREEPVSSRMRSAGVRAMDAHASVTRAARRVTQEMDEVTSPHGVPVVELSEEDSMVVAVDQVRQAVKND